MSVPALLRLPSRLPRVPSGRRLVTALLTLIAIVAGLLAAAPAALANNDYDPVEPAHFISGHLHPRVGVPIVLVDPVFDPSPSWGRITNNWLSDRGGPDDHGHQVAYDTCVEEAPPGSANPDFCMRWERRLSYTPTAEDVGANLGVLIAATHPTSEGKYYLGFLPVEAPVAAAEDDVLTDVRVQTQRAGSDEWTAVDAAHPLYAGNPSRLEYDVHNTSTTRTVPVAMRVIDEHGNPVEGGSETVVLAPGELQTRHVPFASWGLAYYRGAPSPSRRWEVRAWPDGDDEHVVPTELTVRPRPVVLVHGYNSSAAAWSSFPGLLQAVDPRLQAFAVGDGRHPGTENTGSLADPARRTLTVHENAEQVAMYVEGVRAGTGARHVDLVAHSMGGLISRDYLQNLMPSTGDDRQVVGHLVQLGTPNMGSYCADFLVATAALVRRPDLVPQPATTQLTTDFVAGFNRDVTDTRGVPISNLVGHGVPVACGAYVEDGDGVVPTWSARWALPASDLMDMTILHTSMTADADVVSRYVIPRLADDPSIHPVASPAPVAVDSAPVAGPGLGDVFARRLLSVGAGRTFTQTFTPPAGSRIAFSTTASALTLRLIAPDGSVVATSTAPDATVPVVTVGVDHASAGVWTLQATASTRVVDAPLVSLVADSPVSLDVTTAEHDGTTVAFLVSARGGASSVVAGLTAAGIDAGSVRLFDDGRHGDGAAADGTFGAKVTLPSQPGPYAVVVRATFPGGVQRLAVRNLATVNALPGARANSSVFLACGSPAATIRCTVTVSADRAGVTPTGRVSVVYTDAAGRITTVTASLDGDGHAQTTLRRLPKGQVLSLSLRYSGDTNVRKTARTVYLEV